MIPPKNEDEFYQCIFIIISLYMIASYLICFAKKQKPNTRIMMSKTFDAGTFSSSVMILCGVFEPSIFPIIGSTKPFILFAGIVGTIYGAHAPLSDN